MRVGIFVSEAWGPASGIAEIRDRAVAAESLGFPSAWVPYLPWSLDAGFSIGRNCDLGGWSVEETAGADMGVEQLPKAGKQLSVTRTGGC